MRLKEAQDALENANVKSNCKKKIIDKCFFADQRK